MIRLLVNGETVEAKVPAGTVLLDFLRRSLGLMGTKEGCREGDCGACTVLTGERVEGGVRYRAVCSCLLPVGELAGRHVVTIEGLDTGGLSPVQGAIVEEGATQCGFCTPGIVVALTGFLLGSPSLDLEHALAAIDGNICRCTGYVSIRRAVDRLVLSLEGLHVPVERRAAALAGSELLPAYFADVAERLHGLEAGAAPPEGAAEEAMVVAGGTDLFVQQPDRLVRRPLRFLHLEGELRGIRVEGGEVRLGAMTTAEELLHHPALGERLGGWRRALLLVGSTLIRNRATVAGNIVNASPIGDLSILLLALGARLEMDGPDGRRELALADFHSGYKTYDLREGELITAVRFELPVSGARFNFEKVSRREHLDIASVNTAMLVAEEGGVIVEARLSAGGVAPVPLLLREASAWLAGRTVSIATVQGLLERVDSEVLPIGDVRGSAEYKRLLLRRLVMAHLATCFPELRVEELLQ